jgi:hypothetical protein
VQAANICEVAWNGRRAGKTTSVEFVHAKCEAARAVT